MCFDEFAWGGVRCIHINHLIYGGNTSIRVDHKNRRIIFIADGFLFFIFIIGIGLPVRAEAKKLAMVPPTPASTPFTCTSWNLAADFRVSPNQENPNRDACNNPNVWQFMVGSGLTHAPLSYSLASYFTPNFNGAVDVNVWSGTSGFSWSFVGYTLLVEFLSSWPSYSAVYKIDTSIPAAWINSIDEAANTWTNVAPSPFLFLNSPNTPNNNNSISLGPVPDYRTPAYTGPSYVGSDPNLHLIQTFTIFNDQRTFDVNTPPPVSSFSVQAVMTHEIGHWLSLDDIYGLSCVHVTMFAGVNPVDYYQISLEAEDKNGINWLYP